MKRKALLQLLEEYVPSNREERLSREKMIAFVEQNERCFERSLEEGHITASAWLLNRDQTKVLLTHHAKLDKWFQLGGHCDGEADVLAVAIREAEEESGVQEIEALSPRIFDIDIHLIPERGKEKAHLHYDVRFLLRQTSEKEVVVSQESKRLAWVGLDPSEWPTKEPSVVRMFHKWTALKRDPKGLY